MFTTHLSHRVLPRTLVEKRCPHSAFDHCRPSRNLCRTLAGQSQAGRSSASSARNCAGTWTDKCANHVAVMRKCCRVGHGECKVCRAECRKRETCGGVSAAHDEEGAVFMAPNLEMRSRALGPQLAVLKRFSELLVVAWLSLVLRSFTAAIPKKNMNWNAISMMTTSKMLQSRAHQSFFCYPSF